MSGKFPDNLTTAERVEIAKATTRKVLDHFLYLLSLHENSTIVVYSSGLSNQIPTSHAANAFNVFQRCMHHLEIIRLCAIWDTAEKEKECIRTIIELIDDAEVLQALIDETRGHWASLQSVIYGLPENPELAREVREELRVGNERLGDEQASRAYSELKQAIDDAREIMCSPKLKSIRNLRDKHLAHSLSVTRAETKAGPIAPMKYGDERDILDATCDIVEKLYCWVYGASFSISDSRDIDRKNAHALWDGCKFTILC